MRMYDLIEKKKMGEALTTEEIYHIVNGYTHDEIPDYQMSALLMAIYFKGMDVRERYDLTMAMRDSGDILDLSSIDGVKIDKHSTGGVGDKVTLVLGPIIASIGVPVAKMSGRGLGHTGGTIDKLEAFPGFNGALSEEQFISQVNNIKIAVTGQSKNLAPADKKLYALRDVTATVDEISLITGSIMSKKLAAGTDAIVLDVTVGDGAFMKNKESALELAKSMVDIGKRANKKIAAVLTNMDEPLGFAVGNNLEVIEAINALKGNGPEDLMEVVYELGS
ncbi:MAG: thymidine phosphorylase, partial [Pseudobutyrivibrio sp.]|uniref:thymidine phosphorylase n=1 Tax=Pseudobutyrivibrio sp. TaxID=2014367 RepID=UPI0025DD52ED